MDQIAESSSARTCLDSGLHMMDAEVYRAAEQGDIVKLERYDSGQVLLTTTNNTILHVYLTAQTEPSVGTVELMLSKWPSLGSHANGKGDTPLHIAARYGHMDIVRVLLDHHAEQDIESHIVLEREGKREMMRRANDAGESALHEAVRYQHSEVVSFLVGEEDVDYTYPTNKAGESLLYMAAERENLYIAMTILGAFKSPAYQGPNGRTAAHVAVIRGDTNMVINILKKEGLEHLAKDADDKGCTPLHYAAYNLSEPIIEWLLSYDKSAAYVGDNLGMTALHIAVTGQGNLLIINCFLRYCPDSFELVDHKGRSVLHFAVESGSEDTVELILGNKSLGDLINMKDEDGNTPIHLMVASGKTIYQLIFDNRVDKMVFNNKHMNPLDLTIRSSEGYNSLQAIQQRSLREHMSMDLDRHSKMKRQGVIEAEKKDQHANKRKNNIEEDNDDLKEAKEAHLVVAALIATITFAAGFTMPGGYVQEKGPDLGFAVLIRSKAFRAFVITNTIALVFSSAAVFIHIVIAMNTGMNKAQSLFNKALPLTLYALLSMVMAFITGTYAVLPHPSTFAIAVCVVGCVFFLLYGFIFGTVVRTSLKIGQGLMTCTLAVRDVLCCLGLCNPKRLHHPDQHSY